MTSGPLVEAPLWRQQDINYIYSTGMAEGKMRKKAENFECLENQANREMLGP